MKKRAFAIAVGVVLGMVCGSEGRSAQLVPRVEEDKSSRRLEVAPQTPVSHLVVKFREGTFVRLRNGKLTVAERSIRGREQSNAGSVDASRLEHELARVEQLVAAQGPGLRLHRLFSQSEEWLAWFRQRGEERSGRQLADLDLFYRIDFAGRTAGDAAELLDPLNALDSVEIAYASAIPAEFALDAPPLPSEPLGLAGRLRPSFVGATPDYESMQGYFAPAPHGLDVYYAWNQPGGKGTNVRIIDVERSWIKTHEDFPPVFYDSGNHDPHPVKNHGTAVVGMLAAPRNGYGVTGMVYEAQVGLSTNYVGVDQSGQADYDTAAGIIRAAQQLSSNGLILVEIQVPGPPVPPGSCSSDGECGDFGGVCGYLPAEWEPAAWNAIVAATANGIIVVEAAGNGQVNLDAGYLGGYFNRSVRDSAAIIVAAGLSASREPWCATNYGSRIDLHAWGENVMTLGYGTTLNGIRYRDENDPLNQNRWYHPGFRATSAAAPQVTAAAASIRSAAISRGKGPLTPIAIRNLLRDTGTPQVPGPKNIGPMPNLRPAHDSVINFPPAGNTLTVSKTGSGSGTVTSSPAGISCGADCSETYNSGTVVTLSATAATGSIFAGWSGNADCSDGVLSMTQARSCTATFNLAAGNTLTVSKTGGGSGTVTSSPAGISCGADCSETYSSGTVVTLSATAAAGSIFAGWGGDPDCFGDGVVTMNGAQACTAMFNLAPGNTLTVSKTGGGSGTVTSSPAGISCGADCSETYSSGTVVTLSATAAAGSIFAGWGGDPDCFGDGVVTMNGARACTAMFNLTGGTETVWVEDGVPAGAATWGDGGDGWNWVSANPTPFSGAASHQSNLISGMHQHYFYNASSTLFVNPGQVLFAYVYLDPVNLPSEVVLQWNDGTWEHRAYWGANFLGWGTDGTASRRYMGPLPAAGQWVRLEVPASMVGLEGRTLNGMAFSLWGGRATWDRAGKVQDTVWVEDSVPAGGVAVGDAEGWSWVSASPPPYSGTLSHQSNVVAGVHQHYFYNASSTLFVNPGQVLFAYVYLDPANLPSEVMLQWNDGTWEHRAYWGANLLGWGTDGTASRRYMGPLPAAGQWVRLEVPASLVGLEGRTLHGMAFSMWGGRATWDRAGKR